MEVAFAGRPFAKCGQTSGPKPVLFDGQGHANSVQDMHRHATAASDILERRLAVVGQHLAAPARGVIGLGEEAKHQLLDGHPHHQGERQIAVIGDNPVGATLDREAGSCLASLMALMGHHKRHVAHSVEEPHALVEGATKTHEAVQLDQRFATELCRRVSLPRRNRGSGPPSVPGFSKGCHLEVLKYQSPSKLGI